jgi:nicotinamide mononucleotide transporter
MSSRASYDRIRQPQPGDWNAAPHPHPFARLRCNVNVVEIAANAFNAASIFLAGRNSLHMWWTTIVGCVLFAYVFFAARLYADVTLQAFFIGTAGIGWWRWLHGARGAELPVRHGSRALIIGSAAAGIVVAVAYGWLLQRFTDAYAPFLDSIVLAFSVVGQLLLMDRRVESWWCWLLVNTIAVPLYASRGLYVTSVLYAAFWVNAIVALRRWTALARR